MNMKRGLALGAVAGLLVLGGCDGGDTDGGKAKDPGFEDDVFVSEDGTTGTIRIEINDNDLNIGETSGFHVEVKNQNGQGVPNIQIACDSEQGVAIIEPLRGFELTDENGFMSGRIGCERPGSFQMVCRMTVGGNRRKFEGVKCRGDIPAGFQGFPGAAGGGLGGGVQISDDGEVRITAIGFEDDGQFATTPESDASVDFFQTADCDGKSDTRDPEPFYDTYVNIEVENNLPEQVRFSYMTYSIPNPDGTGRTFESKQIGLTRESSSVLDANGDVKNIVIPIFKIGQNNRTSVAGKFAGDPDGQGRVLSQEGLRTVTFTLVGETASGKSVKIVGNGTVAIGDYDRCGN